MGEPWNFGHASSCKAHHVEDGTVHRFTQIEELSNHSHRCVHIESFCTRLDQSQARVGVGFDIQLHTDPRVGRIRPISVVQTGWAQVSW